MKNKRVKFILSVIFIVLLLVTVLLTAWYYISIPNLKVDTQSLDIYLYWSYILTAVALFFAFIVGPINGFIAKPKTALKGLIAAVILLAILGFSWLIGSPQATPGVLYTAPPADWRMADMLLYSAYILIALGFLGMIVAELLDSLH